MFGTRVASSIVMLIIIGVAVYLGGYWYFGVLLAAALVAGWEYWRMLRLHGWHPKETLGALLIVALMADAQWPGHDLINLGLVVCGLAALLAEVFHKNTPGSVESWAGLVAGGVYIGLGMAHFVRLRARSDGIQWIAVAFLTTWICDTAAYMVGSAIGKRHPFPAISPKKTLEGAVAGIVLGSISTMLLARFLLDMAWGWGLTLGLLATGGGSLGDLAESVIKRQVHIKDSSNLIPGHGGMLDRLDSLLFVVPIVYWFATLGAF